MGRIKARVALFLTALALSSVFVAGSPARAADNCHPLPDAVCNTHDWYRECVFARIWYGYSDPDCRA